MFNAIDSTDIDQGPVLNNQIQVALFFIFFVVIFSFFFLNIFVALIILTFQEQGEAEEGDSELDRNQVSVNVPRIINGGLTFLQMFSSFQ